MANASQKHRELEFISPLGQDVLLLHRFKAVEELGRPFNFELTLRSSKEDIEFESLLGQNVSVRLDVSGNQERFFNGYITEFSQGENAEGFATYFATISPWLWFLKRTQDCRIFQEQKATDIIESVFRDNGYTDYEVRLNNSYRNREYTVQYRESDFNFVSRLMEEEGIYYFFKHEEGRHQLVLCDGYSAHEMIPAYEAIPYFPPDSTTVRHEDTINHWKQKRKVLSGSVVLNDFDFKLSNADIHNEYTFPKHHEKADAEIYDYPGNYITSDEGRHYARMRQEEIHCQYATVKGQSTAREFIAGGLMKMTKHPRDDQNTEYLITKVTHKVDQDSFGSTKKGAAGFIYKNKFSVIESLTSFRAACLNKPPLTDGPQHATIVGPAGEEIYCDEFGRAKVQFPWDRYGKNNENSSCWIRVSYNSAGGSFGTMVLPRVGQEVIVDFYGGNPDRPVITGRTYNDMCRVPYALPANKTRMTMKSSTHKGKGSNELRFEDGAGKEEIFMHAQYDQNNVVGNNETTKVAVDRTEDIGNNETITIGNNRTASVGVDESITVGSNRTESVGADETITIGSNRTESVGSNEKISIGSNQSIDVGSDQSLSIGSSQSVKVGKNKTETITIAKALSVGAAYQVSVGAAMNTTVALIQATEVGINKIVKVGNKYSLNANDEISLVTGKSSIVMKSDGTITIKGVDINVIADGEINTKSKKNTVMKGKKILKN
ncbi:MAG: type VI secretion system tip protein VgrG [Cocleimonas sp.]|nr:type VI secretion system tip protein VgrG [Cocleimonas sp.]